MKTYSEKTACFIAFAKLPSDTPLYEMHKSISMGFVVNYETGVIEDIISSLIVPETKLFVRDLLIGHNIHEENFADIVANIQFRYHGGAQRAICVALKQCYDKYYKWRDDMKMQKICPHTNSSGKL